MDGVRFVQPASGRWRVPLLRRCRLRVSDVEITGIVCNVGMLGAYLAVEPVPAIGKRVKLSFQLPWRDAALVIDAMVTWSNSDGKARGLPPGCGVQFLATAAEDRQGIAALVRAFGRREA
jgi:PilZ domain